MHARNGSVRKLPFWHRRRLGWVNAAGFALTLFIGVWMVLAFVSNLLPGADPIEFGISPAFIVVLSLTQVATVALGAVIVFVFMWRGADFSSHTPRLYVFFWTCAGVLFYLIQVVILARFGMVDLPNAASWAEHVYWGCAPIGLAVFGLMAYVNIDTPGAEEERPELIEDEPFDEDDFEDHYDEQAYEEHDEDVKS
jgi:hypothetical protein